MSSDHTAERDQLVARFKTGALDSSGVDRLLILEAMFSGGIIRLLDTDEQKSRWIDIRRSRR